MRHRDGRRGRRGGPRDPGTSEWTVDVPGGRVTVTLDGESAFLRGPAVLVAEGETRPGWG